MNGAGVHAGNMRPPSPWQPDVLGGQWIAQTLDLPKIRGEETRATLVTTTPELTRMRDTAVLYLHGYNDYFFQTHVGDFITDQGAAFYALDLHGYGRSTSTEKDRNDCWSLREYGPELSAAARYLKEERGYQKLVIMAHSTGGLIASLWAKSPIGQRSVAGLILNSPWLDLNRSWFDRVIATTVLDSLGSYLPDYVLTNEGSVYSERLHEATGGLWNFDLNLKRSAPTPIRMGWIKAVREGHLRVHRGLDLNIPILVAASKSSTTGQVAPDIAGTTDTVLDVDQIVARAPGLGSQVDIVQIPQGSHDLALGNLESRTQFFTTVSGWLIQHGFTPDTAATD